MCNHSQRLQNDFHTYPFETPRKYLFLVVEKIAFIEATYAPEIGSPYCHAGPLHIRDAPTDLINFMPYRDIAPQWTHNQSRRKEDLRQIRRNIQPSRLSSSLPR